MKPLKFVKIVYCVEFTIALNIMKMTTSNLLKKMSTAGLFALGLVFIVACSTPKSGDGADSDTEVESESAQEEEEDKSQRPSPPASTTASIDGVNVTIDYSSPAVKGRKIWGDLVPYGKVDRTGANEATVFSVDKDVLVNGELLPAGQYSLFTIPTEGDWTVIFNKVAEQWGAYDYDPAEDALRITVTPEKSDAFNERLELKVNNDGTVRYRWENLTFSFKVSPATAN